MNGREIPLPIIPLPLQFECTEDSLTEGNEGNEGNSRRLFRILRRTRSFLRACFGDLRAPFFHALFDFLFQALIGWFVVTLVRAEIILDHEMFRMIVRILIPLPVPETLGTWIM